MLPQAGVGFSVAPRLAWPRLELRAVAQLWARRRVDLDPMLDVEAHIKHACLLSAVVAASRSPAADDDDGPMTSALMCECTVV